MDVLVIILSICRLIFSLVHNLAPDSWCVGNDILPTHFMAKICKQFVMRLSFISLILNFPLQNTLLFLCIALALLIVSSMLIHYINPPHFLDVSLSAESLYFLYIAGVRFIFLRQLLSDALLFFIDTRTCYSWTFVLKVQRNIQFLWNIKKKKNVEKKGGCFSLIQHIFILSINQIDSF